MMMRRRTLLKSSAALGLSAVVPQLTRAQTGLSFSYGWDASVSAPTEASFYVAPNGDDRAEGSRAQPFRSLQRGVDALAQLPGGSLAIRGGTYRESLDLDALRGTAGAPYRIHRFGRERVTISAADPLTGWAPLDAAEAETLGIPATGLFVARLPLARLQHRAPQALNLHAGGVWWPQAVDRAEMSDPETSGDHRTYHSALFGLDADNHIMAVRDARLIGRNAAQMREVRVLLYHRPNLVNAVDIAGFDPATGTITLADQSRRLQTRGDRAIMLYALQNDPLALGPGSWMYRTTGPDEVSVYLRPTAAGPADTGIEVSLREACIDLGRARHVTLFGLEAVRAAGVRRAQGQCIRRSDRANSEDQTDQGLNILHCRVGDSMAAGERGYGPLLITRSRGVRIHNTTVARARGSFGMFLAGVTGADLRYLHITGVSQSPARFFGLRHSVMAFSLFEDSAWDAHANKFNFYEGSDAVLVYGVRCRRVGGYATYQKASRINFAFCELDCSPRAANRALVSQNRRDGAEEPVPSSRFYYWNNSLLADPAALEPANSLALGPTETSHTHVIVNNILHGGGFGGVYTGQTDPRQEVRSHNRYTGLSFWQGARHGWRLGEGEQQMRPGQHPGPLGRDMRALIAAELAPLFPQFTDWNVDINGTPVTWEAAPIGCEV